MDKKYIIEHKGWELYFNNKKIFDRFDIVRLLAQDFGFIIEYDKINNVLICNDNNNEYLCKIPFRNRFYYGYTLQKVDKKILKDIKKYIAILQKIYNKYNYYVKYEIVYTITEEKEKE